MPVTSIRFYSGPAPRPKPKLGDRRTTKKHGEQVRVFERVGFGPHSGAFVMRSGRQGYVWVSPDEAYQLHPHLRPAAPGAAT